MVDHLPFHELLLFMLFWLCLTSYRAWHRHRPATCQTPPTSAKQVQPGFSDRKPFPGLESGHRGDRAQKVACFSPT